jgi:hypothetical protein
MAWDNGGSLWLGQYMGCGMAQLPARYFLSARYFSKTAHVTSLP